ncbi:NAD(P)-binding protein [Parathielavia appendiculata]|uniref:NAD(P)-binding protein n=1 Tax=Parathielavia appendiculata TaxID=2587402 RepID=A0AAN6U3V8_9PEZI|nr:NAD(P)-binding protein [Parathielavia appendiculata]
MAAPFPSPTKTYHNTTYDSLSPTRPELSAKGKTVLITGGGTGIGAETARYFALAGASRIALLGRREKPLLETKAAIQHEVPGVDIFVAPTDVTKKTQVDAAFAGFLPDGAKLDVVVSGAAVTGPVDPIDVVDPDRLLDTVDQNLRGALYVAQAFLRHAVPNAVAVNISSSAAHLSFGAGFAAYSTAKMACVRLWDSVAAAKPELSVFHIQPGVVDTDMNREVGGVKAIGHEDHVSLPASFNLWLASPESRFLKGKFLWANWDVEELKARREELQSTTQLNIQLGGWPFGDASFKAQWKD